jgi:hypothetical protein
VVVLSALAITLHRSSQHRLDVHTLGDSLRLISGSWDGHWYSMIAAHGFMYFPGQQSDAAFFPGYPLTLRLLHGISGLPLEVTSSIISNLALLAAMFAFAVLSAEVVDRESAFRAARWLAIFPASFVFSMAYPQSLLLLLIVCFALALVRDRFLLAAFLAAGATLMRPEGGVLIIPALAVAFRRWHLLDPRQRGLALGAAATGPVVLAAFPLYLKWALGDLRAWFQTERLWGRSMRLDGIVGAFQHFSSQVDVNHYLVYDLAALVLYLLLLVIALKKRIPRAWILAGAAVLFVPLETGTVQSVLRFGAIVLPTYWVLALAGRNRYLDRALVVLSLLTLAGITCTLPYAPP